MSDPEAYLTNKHVLLNSTGTKLGDNYYNKYNSSASLVETTYVMGRYIQSLSSPIFGSTSTINIPNGSFLGETYLHLELPQFPVVNTTPGAGYFPNGTWVLPRGWGYACIQQIQFLVGSSNAPTITISGESLLQIALAQCSTSEKRSQMINLAGQAQNARQIPTTNEGAGLPLKVTADVLIPLPWSTMCDKLDIDTSLLSNNITINITFKQRSAFMGGLGITAASALDNTPFPTSFSVAQMTFRQGDLANPALSLKRLMVENPSMIYPYPMMHFQTFTRSFVGADYNAASKAQISLQSFINSDLIGIMFYVVKTANLIATRTTETDGGPVNPIAFDNVTDVQLDYNGQPLYKTSGNLSNLVAMIGTQQSSSFLNNFWGSNNVSQANPVNSYLTFIDFSRLRGTCFSNHFYNTFRVSNQTLDLSFYTQTNDNYTLFATYCYNGIIEFKNGQSMIYFD